MNKTEQLHPSDAGGLSKVTTSINRGSECTLQHVHFEIVSRESHSHIDLKKQIAHRLPFISNARALQSYRSDKLEQYVFTVSVSSGDVFISVTRLFHDTGRAAVIVVGGPRSIRNSSRAGRVFGFGRRRLRGLRGHRRHAA